MREKDGLKESSYEATSIISEKDYGSLDWMSRGGGKKWLHPGYIMKAESSDLAHRLNILCATKRMV